MVIFEYCERVSTGSRRRRGCYDRRRAGTVGGGRDGGGTTGTEGVEGVTTDVEDGTIDVERWTYYDGVFDGLGTTSW